MRQEYYEVFSQVEDRHWWFRGRRAVIGALLDRAELPAAPRILDAGCGTGRNLADFARLGPATGADSEPAALEMCRRRGLTDLVEAPVERLPFPDGSFDLVVATDVIEHTDDDAAAVGELRRVTARGGWLLLTVPAYGWLWSRHDELVHHRRRYSRRGLLAGVRAAGLEPRFATYFNTLLLPPIAAVRLLRRRARDEQVELELSPSALDGPLSLPMRLEARLVRRGLRLPAGVSVAVLAQHV